MDKTMNTQNKRKFFAQYWGQEVWKDNRYQDEGYIVRIHDYLLDELVDYDYLELKSLSDISDEDLSHVSELMGGWGDINEEITLAIFSEPAGYYIDGYTGRQVLSVIDYLRSKGYALPWMGISVEKQIDFGWIKLITQ